MKYQRNNKNKRNNIRKKRRNFGENLKKNKGNQQVKHFRQNSRKSQKNLGK